MKQRDPRDHWHTLPYNFIGHATTQALHATKNLELIHFDAK